MSTERNHAWSLDDAGNVTSRPATPAELGAARAGAAALGESLADTVALRTCWDCNPAHAHFLDGAWGDWVLACAVGCGRFFFAGVDITVYDDGEGER